MMWNEFSYRKFASMSNHERLFYELWDENVDDEDFRIDYDYEED